MSSTVHLERSGREATLTLDRPPLNVLDLATIAELGAAVEALAATEDMNEGVAAFLEKRPPCWKHR